VLVAVMAAASALLNAQAPNVSGDWTVSIKTTAPATWVISLKQDGSKISGQVRMGESETLEPLDLQGSIQGSKISLNFGVDTQDGIEPVVLTGEVDGDSIKGEKTTVVGSGEGTWTAKKRTKS
jgi:hypothetical protein